ncbi:hypothetical protein TrLO_g15037 [Triparma laevis f. longispina]|uniref:Uncharacterized protein n=1 Tax=Triparma laevis f. longispina TaxID=1714387 RepID=A0A9W6ZRM0_9STRA|nr:hypothetical protein TrLO_g15037 [Triparma laevis f. longispina]
MSKSIASESNDGQESHKTVSTAPAAVDEFMFTNDFRRLLVGFVPIDALMALKAATKAVEGRGGGGNRRWSGKRCDVGSRWEGYRFDN